MAGPLTLWRGLVLIFESANSDEKLLYDSDLGGSDPGQRSHRILYK